MWKLQFSKQKLLVAISRGWANLTQKKPSRFYKYLIWNSFQRKMFCASVPFKFTTKQQRIWAVRWKDNSIFPTYLDSPVWSEARALGVAGRRCPDWSIVKIKAPDWSMAHLAHVLSEDLVEDVVDWQREAGLVLEQLLHQERVQVVRIHHVIPGTEIIYRFK